MESTQAEFSLEKTCDKIMEKKYIEIEQSEEENDEDYDTDDENNS